MTEISVLEEQNRKFKHMDLHVQHLGTTYPKFMIFCLKINPQTGEENVPFFYN